MERDIQQEPVETTHNGHLPESPIKADEEFFWLVPYDFCKLGYFHSFVLGTRGESQRAINRSTHMIMIYLTWIFSEMGDWVGHKKPFIDTKKESMRTQKTSENTRKLSRPCKTK